MLSKTYRTTMKTIFRTPLIWAIVLLMFGIGVIYILSSHYRGVDILTNEIILDTDPRFVLLFDRYIHMLVNTMWTEPLMMYIVPLLCIIVSGVILTRDWRDSFYEIDNAGDVGALSYFFGRLFAVFTFCTIAALLEELLAFHLYCITRGGLADMAMWDYVIDSNVRILRMFFIVVIPGILFFIGLTFFVGNLTKSGVAGIIIGSSYVLFEYLAKTTFQWKMPALYKDYLSPTSKNLYQYWTFFDTEWFNVKFPHNPFSTEQMLLCLGILYLIAVSLAVGSYICVRRRKI